MMGRAPVEVGSQKSGTAGFSDSSPETSSEAALLALGEASVVLAPSFGSASLEQLARNTADNKSPIESVTRDFERRDCFIRATCIDVESIPK